MRSFSGHSHSQKVGQNNFQSQLDHILEEEFAGQPGLLLDSLGRIVAANDSLAGAPFGVWAPLLDQMDLDVVRTVGGCSRAIVVRARRIVPSSDDPYVPVLLRELPEPDHVMLTHAIGLAIVNANHSLKGSFRRFTVGRLPQVLVSRDIQSATEELILFLVKLAGSLEPQLDVELAAQGTDSLEIAFRIDMEAESNVLRWKDELQQIDLPFLNLDGQSCRLAFDYPHLCAIVRIPLGGVRS